MDVQGWLRGPGRVTKLLSAGFLTVGVTFTVLYAANVTRPWAQIEGELGPCSEGSGLARHDVVCTESDEIWVHGVLLGVPLLFVGLGIMFARSLKWGERDRIIAEIRREGVRSRAVVLSVETVKQYLYRLRLHLYDGPAAGREVACTYNSVHPPAEGDFFMLEYLERDPAQCVLGDPMGKDAAA